jgi:abortive infection bacteriophage resistance protein
MIFEVISLGALSKIYENLKTTDVKKDISKAFLMPPVVFESFLKMLTVVRNYSAHHSRLWNRKVTTNRMRFPRDMGGLWLQNRHVNTEKLYFILSILLYLLNTIIPKNHFKQKFKELQASYPKVSLEMMGFPDNWKNEVLWR